MGEPRVLGGPQELPVCCFRSSASALLPGHVWVVPSCPLHPHPHPQTWPMLPVWFMCWATGQHVANGEHGHQGLLRSTGAGPGSQTFPVSQAVAHFSGLLLPAHRLCWPSWRASLSLILLVTLPTLPATTHCCPSSSLACSAQPIPRSSMDTEGSPHSPHPWAHEVCSFRFRKVCMTRGSSDLMMYR